MPKIILTLLLVFAASAAGARYMPAYTYNSIYVVNDSNVMLTNVTIEDTRYGETRDCGDIEPMGTCQLWFSNRRYQENVLRVSWSEDGSARQSEELQLEVPLTLASGPALRGIINFGADGSLSTSADQPSRR